ncbi:exonuclease SbcCD subunit D, partial [Arthrobacter sp. H5]|uniref:exonuclease SbcCD subunit D n=1 Tax=Arthrobacter sp. H5 TaxID=1267973 RepID=UPI00156706F6
PTHTAVTEAALAGIHADLERRRKSRTVYSVVMAHTFASGGATSDSERELSVGGLGMVPLSFFESFDYAALGHLHGQQQLAGNVRYSGSPLPYSFSEARQAKGAWLVDIGEDGALEVSAVHWPAPRRLAVLRGPLEELLEDPAHCHAEHSYCHITLTDPERPRQAMERLRTRFPDTLVLVFEPVSGHHGEEKTYSQRIAQAADDSDICCGFLEHVRSRAADGRERALITDTIDAARAVESEL